MSSEPLLDVEWWTTALSHRNGSDRGMAEYVVAVISAARSATPSSETWCPTHHKYDHCEDATLAALATPDGAGRSADRPSLREAAEATVAHGKGLHRYGPLHCTFEDHIDALRQALGESDG